MSTGGARLESVVHDRVNRAAWVRTPQLPVGKNERTVSVRVMAGRKRHTSVGEGEWHQLTVLDAGARR